ncbi:MAG: hypothetical protein PHW60_10160 [Kiritimatiellae bacterium]|nr:hypothetical protein [Kiritimatiellia bacterium]
MAECSIETNPLSDYLFLLLGRANYLKLSLEGLPPLPPVVQGLSFRCSLPELVAQHGITDLNPQFWRLVDEYRKPSESQLMLSHTRDVISHEELCRTLESGLAPWRAFLEFWQASVRPIADRVIQGWGNAQRDYAILKTLERITRMPWPFLSCRVFLSVFHTGASVNSNCLFGAIRGREAQSPTPLTLARLIGHEGAHAILHGRNHQIVNAVAGIVQQGLIDMSDIEEIAVIALQHRLPVECGICSEQMLYDGSIDSTLEGNLSWWRDKNGERMAQYAADIYWTFQEEWHRYQTSNAFGTIIDFFPACLTTAKRETGKEGMTRRIGSPRLTREGQPRLPHHPACGSAPGGSEQPSPTVTAVASDTGLRPVM